jgi:hypothetical protein
MWNTDSFEKFLKKYEISSGLDKNKATHHTFNDKFFQYYEIPDRELLVLADHIVKSFSFIDNRSTLCERINKITKPFLDIDVNKKLGDPLVTLENIIQFGRHLRTFMLDFIQRHSADDGLWLSDLENHIITKDRVNSSGWYLNPILEEMYSGLEVQQRLNEIKLKIDIGQFWILGSRRMNMDNIAAYHIIFPFLLASRVKWPQIFKRFLENNGSAEYPWEIETDCQYLRGLFCDKIINGQYQHRPYTTRYVWDEKMIKMYNNSTDQPTIWAKSIGSLNQFKAVTLRPLYDLHDVLTDVIDIDFDPNFLVNNGDYVPHGNSVPLMDLCSQPHDIVRQHPVLPPPPPPPPLDLEPDQNEKTNFLKHNENFNIVRLKQLMENGYNNACQRRDVLGNEIWEILADSIMPYMNKFFAFVDTPTPSIWRRYISHSSPSPFVNPIKEIDMKSLLAPGELMDYPWPVGIQGNGHKRSKQRNFKPFKVWSTSTRRLKFHSVVVCPFPNENPDIVKDSLNIWGNVVITKERAVGWAGKHVTQNYSIKDYMMFLAQRIFRTEENARWGFNFLASLVQHPGQKLGVCMVLLGEQGTGKNLTVDPIAGIYGNSLAYIAGSSDDLNHFNFLLVGKGLVIWDEKEGGDWNQEAAMKRHITADSMTAERKYSDRIVVENFSNHIILSNRKNPEGKLFNEFNEDNRRFQIFETDNSSRCDRDFFEKTYKWMELPKGRIGLDQVCPGVLAIADFWYNWKIDPNWNPKELINTDIMISFRRGCAEPCDVWWGQCLEAGKLLGSDKIEGVPDVSKWDDEELEIEVTTLWRIFIDHQIRTGGKRQSTPAFSKAMRALLGVSEPNNRIHRGTSRIAVFKIPKRPVSFGLYEAHYGIHTSHMSDNEGNIPITGFLARSSSTSSVHPSWVVNFIAIDYINDESVPDVCDPDVCDNDDDLSDEIYRPHPIYNSPDNSSSSVLNDVFQSSNEDEDEDEGDSEDLYNGNNFFS